MTNSAAPMHTFGEALRRARLVRNVSHTAVAAAAGLPAARLAAYEEGTAEITLLEVAALAKALDTTAEALFADAGL